jgi:transketolase
VLRSDLEKAFAEGKKDATRNLSGAAIQVISKHLPNFIGGSADLDPSTKTAIKGSAGVQSPEFSGRNLHFGVREHAMGSLVNGLAYTGAWIPYSATFLVFSDYMRPPMRLAALSHLQSLFLFTHDSFWVGEDGPTHEPIEQIMSLRLMPGMHVYRPADGLEVALCYWAALNRRKGPSTLIFTRQNVTPLTRPASFSSDDILKGGYIVSDDPQAKVVLVATGSEVNVAVDAAKELSSAGVAARVVSMPCVEAFREQPKAYVDSVLGSLPRVTIEAGCTTGWASIVGGEVLSLGIDHYGASAPGEELAERFGFSGKIVAEKVKSWMASRG